MNNLNCTQTLSQGQKLSSSVYPDHCFVGHNPEHVSRGPLSNFTNMLIFKLQEIFLIAVSSVSSP